MHFHKISDPKAAGCLQPAPFVDGSGWSTRRLSTSELTLWAAKFLISRGGPPEAVARLGAHTFKATMLSWCAKAGVAPKARWILGYHVKPKDRMMVTYSRDQMAGPLLDLDWVLEAIGNGSFDPDNTRSGRWRPRGSRTLQEIEAAEDQAVDVEEGAMGPRSSTVCPEPTPTRPHATSAR